MPYREIAYLKKLKTNIFKKIYQAVPVLHKPTIYALESSIHPLNLVRLSL
jgi:hypothetical protein